MLLTSQLSMSKGSDFCVTCVIHVVYANEASCQSVGHERSKYVKLTVENPEFMQNKEAFVGMVIQGAEQLYDRLSAN